MSNFPTVSDMDSLEANDVQEKRSRRLGRGAKGKEELLPPPPNYSSTLASEDVGLSEKQTKAIASRQQKSADRVRADTAAKALRELVKKIKRYGKRFPTELAAEGIKIKTSYRTYQEAAQVYDSIRDIFDEGDAEARLRKGYPWLAEQIENNSDSIGLNCTGYKTAIEWSLQANEHTGYPNNKGLSDCLGEIAIEYGGWFRAGLWSRFLMANAEIITKLHFQNTVSQRVLSEDLADRVKNFVNEGVEDENE